LIGALRCVAFKISKIFSREAAPFSKLFALIVVSRKARSHETRAFINKENEMTFLIWLSLILTLGGAQGPSGDFNDSTAVNQSVAATTQDATSINSMEHSEEA